MKGPPASSGPRRKTIAHMQRLVTTAALVGTVACNRCSSTTGGYAVVDPMPPPTRCPGIAGTVVAKATWLDAAHTRLEVTVQPPTLSGASFAPAVAPPASASAPAPGAASAPAAPSPSAAPSATPSASAAAPADPRVSGGTLVSAGEADAGPPGTHRLVIECMPGVGGVQIAYDATCAAGPATVTINVDWGASADGGKTLAVYVSEY